MTETSGKQEDRPSGNGEGLGTFLLLVAILFAFAIHVYRLDAKSMWQDEGLSIYRAHQGLPHILSNVIMVQGFPTQDTQPPLYFILLHFLIQVAGDSEFAAKFLSVAWGILLVPLFYAFGKRLLGGGAGLWSALIAAFSPVYLWYSQEMRGYTMLVFLTLFSNYALLRLWQSGQESGRQPRRVIFWLILYLLATIAALYTHYTALFVLLFQWVVALSLTIWQRRWWMVALLGGASAFALSFLPFLLSRLQTGAERGYRFVPLFIIVRDLWNSFSLGISVQLRDVIWLDCLFLFVFLLGLLVIGGGKSKTRPGRSLYLLGYLLIPILTLYLLSHLKPMYQGVRHLLIASPPYYLALGVGLDTLARRFRFLSLLVVLPLAGGIAYSTHNCFFDARYAKDDLRSMVRYVKEHIEPGEIVVISDAVTSHLWEYYYGEGLLWTALPPYPSKPGEETIEEMAALAEKYDGVWFAYGPPAYQRDRKGFVKAWFDENLFQVDEVPFYSVNTIVGAAHYLTHPPLLSEPPAIERRVYINFGEELLLLGYDGLPSEIQPGEELELTLYWQVLKRPAKDYSLSFRLLDEEGTNRSQTDIIPFNGFYPISQWEPGKVVAQSISIPSPYGSPPGRYKWELRLYSPSTWQELEVFDEEGSSLGQGGSIGDVELAGTPSTLLPEIPIEHPLREEFVGVIRLVGYDLAERKWRAGEDLHLDLYWENLVQWGEEYRVVLQVLDAVGNVLREGSYPLGHFPADTIAMGRYELVIPPEASGKRCSLVVKVESPASGASLPVGPRFWPFKAQNLTLTQISVAVEERILERPPIQHPLEARLGEEVEFLGYDLEKASIKAGGRSTLVLYWRASREMEVSYTVFIHLLDEEGKIWAQGDSLPCEGSRLTPGWMEGEVIVDRHEIAMPEDMPPGRYRLMWGMYEATSGVRLPVFGAEGRPLGDLIEGAEIEVVP